LLPFCIVIVNFKNKFENSFYIFLYEFSFLSVSVLRVLQSFINLISKIIA
jgi:hypothetical protein